MQTTQGNTSHFRERVLLDRMCWLLLLLLLLLPDHLLARPSPDEAVSLPTPESRWATRGISVSRSSRRAWLPISPPYRFTNCQPGIPTAASSEPPVAPWPPRVLGALVLYHRPANIDFSAGILTRRIWGAAASGTLQAPDDAHARAEPVLGTHPALPACLAPSAVPRLRALLRSRAATGPCLRDRGWDLNGEWAQYSRE